MHAYSTNDVLSNDVNADDLVVVYCDLCAEIAFWALLPPRHSVSQPHLVHIYKHIYVFCLQGFGLSLAFISSFAIIPTYFDGRRRLLVLGFVNLGAGIGTMVMPVFSEKLIESYTWRGVFLILGGLYANIFVTGIISVPHKCVFNVTKDLATTIDNSHGNTLEILKERSDTDQARTIDSNHGSTFEIIKESSDTDQARTKDNSHGSTLEILKEEILKERSDTDQARTIDTNHGSTLEILKERSDTDQARTIDNSNGSTLEILKERSDTDQARTIDSNHGSTLEILKEEILKERSDTDQARTIGNSNGSTLEILKERSDTDQTRTIATNHGSTLEILKERSDTDQTRTIDTNHGSTLEILKERSDTDQTRTIDSNHGSTLEILKERSDTKDLNRTAIANPKNSIGSIPFCTKFISILKNTPFVTFAVSMMMSFSVLMSVIVIIIDFFVSKGIEKDVGVWIYFGMNVANTITRLLTGYLSQVQSIPKLALPCVYMFVGSLSLLLYPVADTVVMCVFLACLFGFSLGGLISLISITTLQLVGKEDYSLGFGIVFTLVGISNAVAGPVAGLYSDNLDFRMLHEILDDDHLQRHPPLIRHYTNV